MKPRDRCTSLLTELVAQRTNNPGGDELALCRHLADLLAAYRPDVLEVVAVPRDVPGTGGYVFARFGEPRLLVNVHLDTVPVNSGWTRDPFCAHIEGERLYGLGTADTKGAIAAALTALAEIGRPRDVAFLFSGDEERAGTVMRTFVDGPHIGGIQRALVCEPTARQAGIRHRGVAAFRARVRGRGGHSSGADHMPRPIVTMAALALGLDQIGRRHLERGPEDMRGLCLNIADIAGGVAFNVVPDAAELTFSIRPPPGFDASAFREELAAVAAEVDPDITLEQVLDQRPFACGDVAGFQSLLGGHVEGFTALDFWTEAAILQGAGIDAVVCGPGDIAQAHAADEFVTLADLDWAVALFTSLLADRS